MKNNTYGERKFISDMYFLGHTSNVHPLVIRARVVVISDGNFTGLSDPKESLETTTESEVGLSPAIFPHNTKNITCADLKFNLWCNKKINCNIIERLF